MNKSRTDHTSHRKRIEGFLYLSTPIVTDIIKQILRSTDCELTHKGDGLNTVFCIKHTDKEIKFHMHNLLLEIATVDRDERCLRFDEKLKDFNYFVHKTNQVIDSKLKVLFELLFEDDFDKAKENIARLGDNYERIRIWQIDQDKKPKSG
ncbi:MAG: hypothetical protein ACYTBV_07445 [Planctomycetota bacterium]